jgi:hypothetical protein
VDAARGVFTRSFESLDLGADVSAGSALFSRKSDDRATMAPQQKQKQRHDVVGWYVGANTTAHPLGAPFPAYTVGRLGGPPVAPNGSARRDRADGFAATWRARAAPGSSGATVSRTPGSRGLRARRATRRRDPRELHGDGRRSGGGARRRWRGVRLALEPNLWKP